VTDGEWRWAQLTPDPRLRQALAEADEGFSYADAVASGNVDAKRNWSNRFADSSARFLSSVVRQALSDQGAAGDLEVYPAAKGGAAERTVILGEGSRKRIDVAVIHRLGGLRIDLSMKGLNFRDKSGDHYDKNLTGRTYELEDEIRQVRRLQPAAFVFALYWLPIPAASDKASGESSFARTVVHLRARIHKGAPGTARDPERLDGAGVALYAATETPLIGGEVVDSGVVRCLDVTAEPPRRGRPRIESTSTVDELVARWARIYLEAVGAAKPEWAEPEEDLPPVHG
jgi:hypothetical protein